MLQAAPVTEPSRQAAPATVPAVELSGVDKVFGAERGQPVEALRGIDLAIGRGEFVCVLGASGCGKSTLLRIVAGFDAPTGGTVAVGGAPVRGPGPDRAVVFQDYGLFPWLSVAENVGYGPRERGLSRQEVRSTVDRLLGVVGLARFADHYPHQLSGGMQQRVAIARVLANDPAVLLMDEPFGALDSLTRQSMQEELRAIWQDLRPTVVFVTHSVEEAVYLADRVVVMAGGPSHGCPGHIDVVAPVGLPHPRDVTAAAFNDLKRELLGHVHRSPAPPLGY